MAVLKIGRDLLTLKDFLRLPEVKPAFEYYGGRVIQKMSPGRPHSVLQGFLNAHPNQFVRPRKLGLVYSELRCTFGKSSYAPDLCFIARGRIPRGDDDQLAETIRFAPDFAVEILSPGQTEAEVLRKLRSAMKHGLRLGWFINPRRRRALVLRPGGRARVLRPDAMLDGEEIIPGYSLLPDEMLAWLDED